MYLIEAFSTFLKKAALLRRIGSFHINSTQKRDISSQTPSELNDIL
jgi:hypothetical protein